MSYKMSELVGTLFLSSVTRDYHTHNAHRTDRDLRRIGHRNDSLEHMNRIANSISSNYPDVF